MPRFRRYRAFVFAVFTIALLYHFTSVGDLGRASSAGSAALRQYGLKGDTTTRAAAAAVSPGPELESRPPPSPATIKTLSPPTSLIIITTSTQQEEAITIPTTSSTQWLSPTVIKSNASLAVTSANAPAPSPTIAAAPKVDKLAPEGQGRHEPPPPLKSESPIHWARLPDHFPVPSESIIQLPTARPSPIAKIQHAFTDESPSDRVDRERKLNEIKEAFKFSWAGYKRPESWLQDELSPVSGGSRNPFCGWAATLVDALDTLWIMDLKEDFQQAALAVGEIDFTTSIRNDIPLFETTIRYLGGLLSSYELSGGQYKVLLKKAVELADVLMGAFDTPNRMPIMYYYWKPTFATQPHRANTRATLAEIGSLSMEFTKLAQLTKESRYYDAVARITNEFDIWQNHTKIPGLWPTFVDASGCRKPEEGSSLHIDQTVINGQDSYENLNAIVADNAVPIDSGPSPVASTTSTTTKSAAKLSSMTSAAAAETSLPRTGQVTSSDLEDPGKGNLKKRQIAMDSLNDSMSEAEGSEQQNGNANLAATQKAPISQSEQSSEVRADCEAQGLSSPPGATREGFTLGAMGDSVYEYLPKQYMLLGGLVTQYKTMYERAVDAATKYLLFRPMLPNNEDILVMGSAYVTDNVDISTNLQINPEQQHLLCFAGGMYAIGAKIFNRPDDLDIAAKLTEGCVWAYGSTKSGVMPEAFNMMPCLSRTKCEWNKTRWYEALDPYRSMREQNQQYALEQQQKHAAAMREQEEHALPEATTETPAAIQTSPPVVPLITTSAPAEPVYTSDPLAKRQLGNVENDLPASNLHVSTQPDTEKVESRTSSPVLIEPDQFPTHEEYVESRILNERISDGVTDYVNRKYILRPEAIESVFIMYRITGDPIWRQKGWKMWTAINKTTRTNYGYSSTSDATSEFPSLMDEMESFWLAETLKYFYLLFSTPDTISLDEYVLNTEAHPFKRPT